MAGSERIPRFERRWSSGCLVRRKGPMLQRRDTSIRHVRQQPDRWDPVHA
jgi:hypothetical protein